MCKMTNIAQQSTAQYNHHWKDNKTTNTRHYGTQQEPDLTLNFSTCLLFAVTLDVKRWIPNPGPSVLYFKCNDTGNFETAILDEIRT